MRNPRVYIISIAIVLIIIALSFWKKKPVLPEKLNAEPFNANDVEKALKAEFQIANPTEPEQAPRKIFLNEDKNPSKGTTLFIQLFEGEDDFEINVRKKAKLNSNRKYMHHVKDHGCSLGKVLKQTGNYIKVEGAGDRNGWVLKSDYYDRIYYREKE